MKEEQLKIAVEKVHVNPKPGSKFGLVQPDCYISLSCFLARIILEIRTDKPLPKSPIGPEFVSYEWHWMGRERNKRIPPDVYLDSPKSDFENIKGVEARLYCVPAHKDSDGDLVCLLLQSLEKEVDGLMEYRRVGLTVIPAYQAELKMIWDSWEDYFGKRHRIRLV